MKAIGIFGYHHTGKTTLAAMLISALKEKGYEVAAIKDIHNENYHSDKEGSNSWRLAEAGANPVFAKGLYDAALIFHPAPELADMLPFFNVDWLVIEGFQEAALPKILCAENLSQIEELFDPTVIAITGEISQTLHNYQDIPVLDYKTDFDKILSLVLSKTFDILPQSDPQCCSACSKTCYQMAIDILQGKAKREDCVLDGKNSITISIGGKPLTLVPFVQNLFRDTICAMISNLKGVDLSQDIEIMIKGKDGRALQ